MEIGRKIKENRVNKELTQEQLAKKLNVSRTTISSWETGRTYPDLEMIVRFIFRNESILQSINAC